MQSAVRGPRQSASTEQGGVDASFVGWGSAFVEDAELGASTGASFKAALRASLERVGALGEVVSGVALEPAEDSAFMGSCFLPGQRT